MWRLSVLYAKLARPQLTAGLVTVLVAGLGGYSSIPQILRPAQAVDTPIIQPVKIQAAEAPEVQSLATSAAIDCSQVACLALTFDDGPDPEVTPRVLDILARHGTKATFFLIGLHVPGNEALVKRIHESGHEIGNHTWSHRQLSGLSPQEVEDDIARAQAAITAAGAPTPHLFRPPYGAFDSMVRSHVPMTLVSWNIDPEDWKAKKPEKIVEHVLAHAKPGAIVDLHDIYPITADALESIIVNLQPYYHLVTVSELLNLPPGQPGIFYGR